ncbi:MAG TPA: GGDEF domain-containing protein [Terracidiphilus sp.]|nr:GGDEF domain-containing protein [Terracidiphilus sp.]
MISLKKYLDSDFAGRALDDEPDANGTLPAALSAYGSALLEMGNASIDACPGLGDGLKQGLAKLGESLSAAVPRKVIETIDKNVQQQLQDWGRSTARHYQEKTCEVKDLLLVMAQTAQSVGSRDQRCAGRMNEVTDRLKAIASLEDLTEIRASIVKSAAELKTSIDRMAEEGKAAVDQLRKQVSTYEAKLEAAEELASRDPLTRVRSRLYVESQIERRVKAPGPFCVAIVDIDGFKRVNDQLGHLVGDDLLKQFAAELRSVCRSTDTIGRWGGDEFLLLLDCGLDEATAQTDRVRKWVCGSYTVQSASGPTKLDLHASIGLAERAPNETMKDLLARADAAMYHQKAGSRSAAQR